MKSVRMKPFLLILFCLISFQTAYSFQANTEQKAPRKKIGLALSGGASKGFAHLGVIQVLVENNIPIDYIAGTSMGAIVGGLYSVGYSIDSLTQIFKTIEWNEMYFDAVGRTSKFVDQRQFEERFIVSLPFRNNEIQLPDGLITGQRFYNELLFYTLPVHDELNFDKFAIPFRAIATNLNDGKPFVFKNGSLATAIRASMSIPTILKPVEINGIKFIDGGISRNLPAKDVLDMGADIVIGVNVGESPALSKDLTSIFSILDQTVSFQVAKNVKEQIALCDVLIKPELDNFGIIDFDSLETYIQRGRDATIALLPQIKKLIETQKSVESKNTQAIPSTKKVYIFEQIQILGLKPALVKNVRSIMKSQPFAGTDLETLKTDIDLLLGTGLFENISYTIEESSSKNKHLLKIYISEKFDERFRFGLRYDDYSKASFLFNSYLRDRLFESSELSSTIRLGEEFQTEISYRKFSLIPPRLAVSARLNIFRTPIPLYTDLLKVAELQLSSISTTIDLSSIKSKNYQLLISLKNDYYSLIQNIGFFNLKESNFINQISLSLIHDNLESLYFPKYGTSVKIKGNFSKPYFLTKYDYSQILLKIEQVIPVFSTLTIDIKTFNGISKSNSLPNHYSFIAGGNYENYILGDNEVPFIGFKWRQLNGTQLHFARTDFNIEFSKDNYLSLIGNYGIIGNSFSFVPEDYKTIYGYGVQYGIKTAFGPLLFAIVSGSEEPLFYTLSFGYRF